jgi:hypothetical protein
VVRALFVRADVGTRRLVDEFIMRTGSGVWSENDTKVLEDVLAVVNSMKSEEADSFLTSVLNESMPSFADEGSTVGFHFSISFFPYIHHVLII